MKTLTGFGLLVLAGGLFVLIESGTQILGSAEENRSSLAFLLSLPARLVSVLGLVVGLGLIAIGLLKIAAPGVFDALLDGLIQPIKQSLPTVF